MSSVDMVASWSSSASSTAIAAAGAGAPDDDITGGVGFGMCWGQLRCDLRPAGCVGKRRVEERGELLLKC